MSEKQNIDFSAHYIRQRPKSLFSKEERNKRLDFKTVQTTRNVS